MSVSKQIQFLQKYDQISGTNFMLIKNKQVSMRSSLFTTLRQKVADTAIASFSNNSYDNTFYIKLLTMFMLDRCLNTEH